MEFISIEDAEHIPSPDGLASSSFDLKVTAQQRGASTSMLAVFYDPISYTERNFNEETARWSNEQWQQHYTESHKAALAESEVFLRQQANAFVEWLLAEGLIESRLPVGGYYALHTSHDLALQLELQLLLCQERSAIYRHGNDS
jgi:hypothetical protein